MQLPRLRFFWSIHGTVCLSSLVSQSESFSKSGEGLVTDFSAYRAFVAWLKPSVDPSHLELWIDDDCS